MKTNRIVFDTNVIISALILPKSMTRRAFETAKNNCTILMSAELLTEISDVIGRKRFDRYVPLSKRENFLAKLASEVEMIEIKTAIAICRDPKDDKVLELAVNGQADCLVSGDQDLLVLHPFQNISIINPSSFLQSFTQ